MTGSKYCYILKIYLGYVRIIGYVRERLQGPITKEVLGTEGDEIKRILILVDSTYFASLAPRWVPKYVVY